MSKPTLKCKKASLIKVDYRDLEKLICEVYGKKEYSLVASEEWGNYEDHEIEPCLEDEDEYDKEDLKEWINGNKHDFVLQVIMNDLLRKGVIESGTYLIHIFW